MDRETLGCDNVLLGLDEPIRAVIVRSYILWHPFIFLFKAAGEFSLPYPLPTAAPRSWELLCAAIPAEKHRLTLFVDLRVEGGPIVYYDGFLDDEVFVLEIFPITVEKLEPALHCAHILQRHAELKIVHKEASLVCSVNGVLLLISLLVRSLENFLGGLFDGQILS